MKYFLIILVYTFTLTASFASELPNKIPSEIQPFEEKGTIIIAWKAADLNGDGLEDYLVVLEIQKKSSTDIDMSEKQRPVLIIVRQQDGSLSLASRNDRIVSCSTCGGDLDDGFSDLVVSKQAFSISNHTGGTSAQTTVTYSFGYSRRDATWQLVRVETNQEELNNSERYTRIKKPPVDFGKIDFTDFNPYNYRGQGEGYVPRKRKSAE